MRFMMMYTPAQNDAASGPPSPEHRAAMGKYIDEGFKSGELLSTGGLLPLSKGASVRSSGGKITVTDGPFAETKEVIAGYAIVEAESKESAIEMARRFLKIAGDGESEIRQVMEAAESPA